MLHGREVDPILTGTKACQKRAWKHYHKFECSMFSETPGMYTFTRALYRLLNMNKYQLLSLDQWSALYALQPNIREYLSTKIAGLATDACEAARFRTNTDLGASEVLILYFIVSTRLRYGRANLLIYPMFSCIPTLYPFSKQKVGISVQV